MDLLLVGFVSTYGVVSQSTSPKVAQAASHWHPGTHVLEDPPDVAIDVSWAVHRNARPHLPLETQHGFVGVCELGIRIDVVRWNALKRVKCVAGPAWGMSAVRNRTCERGVKRVPRGPICLVGRQNAFTATSFGRRA